MGPLQGEGERAAEGTVSPGWGSSGNRGLAYTDPFGLWPPETHDVLILHALRGIASAQDIAAIQHASRSFDVRTQLPGQSYLHSMRDPGQSTASATQERNHFVATTLTQARELEASGDHAGALKAFGEATHPEVDRTSPAHTDAQGNPRLWVPVPGRIGAHSREESGRPSRDAVQQSDRLLQSAYNFVFGGP